MLARYTRDSTACFLVCEVSPEGEQLVACNERMSELFVSTQEYRGLVAQIGTSFPPPALAPSLQHVPYPNASLPLSLQAWFPPSCGRISCLAPAL